MPEQEQQTRQKLEEKFLALREVQKLEWLKKPFKKSCISRFKKINGVSFYMILGFRLGLTIKNIIGGIADYGFHRVNGYT